MKKIVASMLLVPILALAAIACVTRDRTAEASQSIVVHQVPGGTCVAIVAQSMYDKSIALAMTPVACPADAGPR